MNHNSSWRSHQQPDEPLVFTTSIYGAKSLKKTEIAVQKIYDIPQIYGQLSSADLET